MDTHKRAHAHTSTSNLLLHGNNSSRIYLTHSTIHQKDVPGKNDTQDTGFEICL